MSNYPPDTSDKGRATSVLQSDRLTDKLVLVKSNLPCSVIVVHGVNDVGVGYEQVERGLCAGLDDRLAGRGTYQAADYRMPTHDEKGKLEIDPDAVFFKRHLKEGDHTPVIPFYWGFREQDGQWQNGAKFAHGQNLDRHGNRLDKDLSKGGGPFSNATSTLPDMWNRGFSGGPGDPADFVKRDPLRPVLKAPGRMYMVLAAQRLAALVSMIRFRHPDDVISLVAHSQGCLLSLLAQAFLMQLGERPADTLVLTHPPYSLTDDVSWKGDAGELFGGDEDAAMKERYGGLGDRQTLHARLQTLVNIVKGVVDGKKPTLKLESLKEARYHGMVGAAWQPSGDRDNRGKVYLYFCPEDMTVALSHVAGIGWEGVPDHVEGSRLAAVRSYGAKRLDVMNHSRQALKELGPGFFQRVFTAKRRVTAGSKAPQPVLVGAVPHDFVLRVKGEDDHAHVAAGEGKFRVSHPEVAVPPEPDKWLGMKAKSAAEMRSGIRSITGEKLNRPVEAEMYAGSVTLTNQPKGAHEAVDPIDAVISTTSDYGLLPLAEKAMADPRPRRERTPHRLYEFLPALEIKQVTALLNRGKEPTDTFTIDSARYTDGETLLVIRRETPNEARLRQQGSNAPRSFHGAIFGSELNHRQVTAYDIAIGGGKAVSDPNLYAYLCAVADWRLKKPDPQQAPRPGILTLDKFMGRFSAYLSAEAEWRRNLIEGNCDYYSTGRLPTCLPVLPEGLPPSVLSETMDGKQILPPVGPPPVKKADAEPETIGQWLAKNPLPDDADFGDIA